LLFVQDHTLDTWSHHSNEFIDLRLSPQQQKILLNQTSGLPFKVLVPNLNKILFNSQGIAPRLSPTPSLFLNAQVQNATEDILSLVSRKYFVYEEILTYYDALIKVYPKLIQKATIYQSYEGRDVHAIRLGTSNSMNILETAIKRNGLIFLSGVHVRNISNAPCWACVSSIHILTNRMVLGKWIE
jgi:hypothetical protein